MSHHPVYGLDIEIGHARDVVDPIDPLDAPIVAVALSTERDEWKFTGHEASLLRELDSTLALLEPGIIATWNGSRFDLPYLADRATICGVKLGLHLAADRRWSGRSEVLRGHDSAYRAAWHRHKHLDALRIFRSGRGQSGPADVPGEELRHEASHAFAVNDAKLVRVMVQRRLPGAARQADRVQLDGNQPSGLFLRERRVPLSPAHPAVRAMLSARR